MAVPFWQVGIKLKFIIFYDGGISMVKVALTSGKIVEATDAAGVDGVIIRSGSSYFFRVYDKEHGFTDYALHHDDLAVSIKEEALASFYSDGEKCWVDHSPSVLGLQVLEK